MEEKDSCDEKTYIYLYTPEMSTTSSSSSSISTRCLIFSIVLLSIGILVILLGLFFYHQNQIDRRIQLRRGTIAKQESFSTHLNLSVDPCDDFDQWICEQPNRLEEHFHLQFLSKLQSNPFYNQCHTTPSGDLITELTEFFEQWKNKEPYRSFLTLFQPKNNRTRPSTISFPHNPFFQLISTSTPNTWNLVRRSNRNFPSVRRIFSNVTDLNRIAFEELIQFEKDYEQLVDVQSSEMQLYQRVYNEDSLILARIYSYRFYHRCHGQFNQSNGLEKFIVLLKEFLRERLKQFNTKLIDNQIVSLSQLKDNHTLIEHLRRIYSELKMIEKILSLDQQRSCLIDLFEELLDRRLKRSELPRSLWPYLPSNSSFFSTDWPYLMLIADHVLENSSLNTLINYMYFDLYRQIIYPYYQPHLPAKLTSALNFTEDKHRISLLNHSCNVISDCYAMFNCYHPSLLNELVGEESQINLNEKKRKVEDLLHRLRDLIERSDYLYILEKRSMIEQLNRIEIRLGHYSSTKKKKMNLLSSSFNGSSYLDQVQEILSLSPDHMERSYHTTPIFDLDDHVLFLPFGFLSIENERFFDYSIVKLLLKLLRHTIQSDPFHIECSTSSSSSDDDLHHTDEDVLYLFFREKFLSEKEILLDEYLWPYMSANSAMKAFLLDYSRSNLCSQIHGKDSINNFPYLYTDLKLLFHCQMKNSIEQMNCHLI